MGFSPMPATKSSRGPRGTGGHWSTPQSPFRVPSRERSAVVCPGGCRGPGALRPTRLLPQTGCLASASARNAARRTDRRILPAPPAAGQTPQPPHAQPAGWQLRSARRDTSPAETREARRGTTTVRGEPLPREPGAAGGPTGHPPEYRRPAIPACGTRWHRSLRR